MLVMISITVLSLTVMFDNNEHMIYIMSDHALERVCFLHLRQTDDKFKRTKRSH